MTNDLAGGHLPRLRAWYLKLAYFVAASALVYLVAAIPVGPGGGGILRSALAFVLVLGGARLFRGPDESDAPRVWWRMTALVPAGIVLGGLFAGVAFLSAAGYVGLNTLPASYRAAAALPALLANTVLAVILAYLYFGSSRRLVLERRAKELALARNGR